MSILKKIRVSACTKTPISPKDMQNIKAKVKKIDIHKLPKKTVYKELVIGAKCDNYFRIMDDVGLLDKMFPEVHDLKGLKQNPRGHTMDAYGHTMGYIDNLPNDSDLRIVGLLHDIGKGKVDDPKYKSISNQHNKISVEMSKDVLKRYGFPSKHTKRITRLIDEHMVFDLIRYQPDKTIEEAERDIAENKSDILDDLVIMTRADVLSDSPRKAEVLARIDTQNKDIHKFMSEKNIE